MQKKGISLIVLVITIIVMIILAASVVISLANNGIIEKANTAVRVTNLKNVEQILNIAWAEAYHDKVSISELESAIDSALQANNIDKNLYNITVTSTGVTVIAKEQNSGGQDIVIKTIFSDGSELTWEELKSEANGQKYGYNASAITDTEIGKDAFRYCREITSLVIPEGITKIDDGAFAESNIMNISIPDSVTYIGAGAFWDNGITTINISKNVTYIGSGALFHMESINIDPDNPNYSSENGVFYNKNKTELIKYPYLKYEESFVIPNTVTTISALAFSCESGPVSITIPNSITNIDAGTFDEAYGLKNIYVYSDNPNYTTVNGVLYDKSMTKLIKYPYNKQDAVYTLPTTVTTIGKSAFYQGVAPFEFVIPSTDKTLAIEDFAFGECAITSITLPANINKDIILSMNGSFMLTKIVYNGTVAQWNSMGLDEYQSELYIPSVEVECTDGTLTLSTAYSE